LNFPEVLARSRLELSALPPAAVVVTSLCSVHMRAIQPRFIAAAA
jgi:hypothetical protein